MKLKNSMIAGALCFGISSQAFADLNNGLIAYYPFNGNANDESGNSNNGTVHGAILAQDRFGNTESAYAFDEDGDFIEVWLVDEINANINTNEGSISVWIKPNKNELYPRSGFVYQYFSNQDDRLYLDIDQQNSNDSILSAIGDSVILTNTPADYENWQHVVTTWKEDGTVKIYLNNTLDVEGNYSNPGFAFQGSEKFYIGRGWQGNPGYYNGLIDDIRIYNRILSESEIRRLFREKNPNNCTDSGYTQTDINNAITQGKQEGIAQCQANPASCGISTSGGSNNIGTVSSNFDIYVPSLDYQTLFDTQNIWINFEYFGINNGRHTWGLSDYGVNQ